MLSVSTGLTLAAVATSKSANEAKLATARPQFGSRMEKRAIGGHDVSAKSRPVVALLDKCTPVARQPLAQLQIRKDAFQTSHPFLS